jgi:flagellar protein FliJ
MAKFKYELQEILEYRNFQKDEAQAELGKALAVENSIQDNLNQIANQYLQSKKSMKNSTDIQDIISESKFNNLLEYQKEELLKQLASAKIVSEEKRKKLQEIIQKTTALEKLKEKQQEAYVKNEEFLESEEFDDLATLKFKKIST